MTTLAIETTTYIHTYIHIYIFTCAWFMYCIVQVNRLGMDVQIDYFAITRKQFDKLLGASQARDYIMKKSIFSITVGANDFLNNYLLPVLSIGARISESPDAFIDDMLSHFRGQLTVWKSSVLLSVTSDYLKNIYQCVIFLFGCRDYTKWMLENL